MPFPANNTHLNALQIKCIICDTGWRAGRRLCPIQELRFGTVCPNQVRISTGPLTYYKVIVKLEGKNGSGNSDLMITVPKSITAGLKNQLWKLELLSTKKINK